MIEPFSKYPLRRQTEIESAGLPSISSFFVYFLQKKTNRLKTEEINRLTEKISHLSIQNKLLIYKAVIKPIWSYGIQCGVGTESATE
jgi:hypothetical protein